MSREVSLETSGGSRIPKLAGALGLFAVAGLLGWLAIDFGFLAAMGAFIFGAAGLSVLAFAFGWAGKGPCPSCGKELDDLPADLGGFACSHCGTWLRIEAKRMTVTPDGHVAGFPTYPVRMEVGGQPTFASLCVCCGQPASAMAPYEMRKTVVGAPGTPRLVKAWPIQIPVCAAHGTLSPGSDVTSFEGELRIKSFAAFRALGR